MAWRTHRILPFTLVAVSIGWGCSTPDAPRLTYEACTAGEACDLNTVCTPVPASLDGGLTVHLCTTSCGTDLDCPGLDAVCLLSGDGGTAGTCYRSCAPGCRPGTACVQSAAGGRGVCTP